MSISNSSFHLKVLSTSTEIWNSFYMFFSIFSWNLTPKPPNFQRMKFKIYGYSVNGHITFFLRLYTMIYFNWYSVVNYLYDGKGVGLTHVRQHAFLSSLKNVNEIFFPFVHLMTPASLFRDLFDVIKNGCENILLASSLVSRPL